MKTYLQHVLHPIHLWCRCDYRHTRMWKWYEKYVWQRCLRSILTMAVLMIVATAGLAYGEVVATVNDPTATIQRQYTVRQRFSGARAVYRNGNPFEPVYIIRPNGSVYRPGDPFTRVSEIDLERRSK